MYFFTSRWFIIFISVFTGIMILLMIVRIIKRKRALKQQQPVVVASQPHYVYVQQPVMQVSQPSAPPMDPIYR